MNSKIQSIFSHIALFLAFFAPYSKDGRVAKFRRDNSATSGLVVLLVGVIIVGALFAGGILALTPKGQAYVPSGAGAGGVPAAPPPAPQAASISAPVTVADMLAWNNRQTQGANLASTFNDKTAGAAVTAGTGLVVFWDPGVAIYGANPLVRQASPSGSSTTESIKAGGYYQQAFTDASNTYYPQSLCDPENLPPVTTTSNGMTACQVQVQPNPYVANPTWTLTVNARRVGAMVDPVDESATTDARNVQWANGQANITNPDGSSIAPSGGRCLVSTTSAAGTQISNGGNLGAPANGNIIFFNDTACSGTFYIESSFECGTSANRWCYLPVLHPKWAQNNGTGSEFSAVTITMAQGGLFQPASPDATTAFNAQQPIPLGSTPWVQSAIINYLHTAYSYTAANFAKGKCFIVYSDDIGGYLNGMVNQTLTGSAATSYEVCRAN